MRLLQTIFVLLILLGGSANAGTNLCERALRREYKSMVKEGNSFTAYHEFEQQQTSRFNVLHRGSARVAGDWSYASECHLDGVFLSESLSNYHWTPAFLDVLGIRQKQMANPHEILEASDIRDFGLPYFYDGSHTPAASFGTFPVDAGTSLLSSYHVEIATNNVYNLGNLIKLLYWKLYTKFYELERGRREHRERYHFQDVDGADRTTHFVAIARNVIVGHVQVKASRGPSETINIDDNYPGAVPRAPGLTLELGRLFFDLKTPHTNPELDGLLNDPFFRRFARLSLLQKAFSWITHDVWPERVRGQVNDKMLEWLMSEDSPLHFSILTDVQGEYGREWILEMSRSQMMSSEDFQTANLLLIQLKNFLILKELHPYRKELVLKFDRNQVDSLTRLGFFKPVDEHRNSVVQLQDNGWHKGKQQNFTELKSGTGGLFFVDHNQLTSKFFILAHFSPADARQVSARLENRIQLIQMARWPEKFIAQRFLQSPSSGGLNGQPSPDDMIVNVE